MKASVKYLVAASAASLLAISAAQAETKTFDFSGFTGIEASVGVDVEVSVGGDYAVRAEGNAKELERLRIERRGETLKIDRNRKGGWFQVNRRSDFTVFVTMPSLEEVEVSSGADVTATSIDADRFRVSVSSGADASLSGTCNTIEADGSSGADLDAEDLRCANAVADVSSGADLSIYASESVEADASSGGSIRVYGGPQSTDVSKSSGGSISIRN